MARAVLDPGVLVSALITPTGTPAKLLLAAREGSFELLGSPLLLEELEAVPGGKKFRRYVDLGAVDVHLDLVRNEARRPGPIGAHREDPRLLAR